MNLQVLVAVAEIVNALAVTFSLIALIISIRQNTKSQKALVVTSMAAAIASINVPAMESHTLGSAISKATTNWGSASREERIMTHYFLFSFFKLSENPWYQQKSGILGKAQWLGWETLLRKYYHSDGVCRVWWPGRQHAYSPEFQKYVLCFSDDGPEIGPHPISQQELKAAFNPSNGWNFVAIEPDRVQTNYHDDGAPAWLATIKRVEA